jgi:hypothetical protein
VQGKTGARNFENWKPENTKRELVGFLEASDFPPREERLRLQALGWLGNRAGPL